MFYENLNEMESAEKFDGVSPLEYVVLGCAR